MTTILLLCISGGIHCVEPGAPGFSLSWSSFHWTNDMKTMIHGGSFKKMCFYCDFDCDEQLKAAAAPSFFKNLGLTVSFARTAQAQMDGEKKNKICSWLLSRVTAVCMSIYGLLYTNELCTAWGISRSEECVLYNPGTVNLIGWLVPTTRIVGLSPDAHTPTFSTCILQNMRAHTHTRTRPYTWG